MHDNDRLKFRNLSFCVIFINNQAVLEALLIFVLNHHGDIQIRNTLFDTCKSTIESFFTSKFTLFFLFDI